VAKPSRASEGGPVENLEKVAEATRQVVRAMAPQLRTETKWGMPWLAGKDLVLVVGAFTHHVGVEFWRGASLTDPHGLLAGTGKNLRHVKLRTVAEARAPAFAALIRDAVRLDARSEKRTR
jgi:hypothetical protein